MLSVLSLFLLPVGGGIPAGVLLARSSGIPWAVTAGLYLVSDLLLALAFEPVLRLVVLLGGRVAFLARLFEAVRLSTERLIARAAPARGTGPLSLFAISFGIDPMTGRTAALAAGHGIVAGWALAIAGDMLYYAVVAAATLGLNAYVKDPGTTIAFMLLAMILVPVAAGRLRSRSTGLSGRGRREPSAGLER